MLDETTLRLKNTPIRTITEYCNLTGCSIEYGNGGNEIIVIPPGCK